MSRISYFLAVVLLLTFAGNVAGHDMFVMPDKFLIPQTSKYSLKNGESLPVQVLFKGAPAAGLAATLTFEIP